MIKDTYINRYVQQVILDVIQGVNDFNTKGLCYKAYIPKEIIFDLADNNDGRIKFTVKLDYFPVKNKNIIT